MAMKQGINVPVVFMVGLIGVLILINLVFGVQAWYHWSADLLLAQRAQGGRDRDLRRVSEEQIANVSQVRFTDDSKQFVAVPIDTAMQMWLDQNGQTPAKAGDTAPRKAATQKAAPRKASPSTRPAAHGATDLEN